jgi:hypothetical protein
MKPAKAWVWKAGVVPVRAFYQRGPEAVSRPARPARHAVDSAKYGEEWNPVPSVDLLDSLRSSH